MGFRIGKSAPAAGDPLLERFGLAPADISAPALKALRTLEAERAELAERLTAAEALADRDTLTPTLNRRGFMLALHRTMSAVERYRTPAAVLYLDLDGFKAINDRYGHAAGDAVLCGIGRLLLDQVRESDVVGRLGGDEFGVILNRVAPDEAQRKADSLAALIDGASIPFEGVTHRVRASIGAHMIAVAEDPETALARADEAMYVEKYARRSEAAKFASF